MIGFMIKITSRDRIQMWQVRFEQKLEDLQKEVGGYIETVPDRYLMDGLVWVVNEEGKLNGSRYNRIASFFVFYDKEDVIFGDALLMKKDINDDGETFLRPLTRQEARHLLLILMLPMTEEEEDEA